MSIAIPIPANIASITAPLLLGSLFDFALYGVLALQTYIYAVSFHGDKPAIKWLVMVVFVIETVQVCMTASDIYHWLAAGFGNLLSLDDPFLSPFDTPIMCGIVSLIVQFWFCYRIWILNKKAIWMSGIIAIFSVTQATGALIGGVKGHMAGHLSGAHAFIYAVYIWLIGSAVADVLIAATMAYLLLKARTENQHYTNSVLNGLVRLIVESNTVTAGMAILALIIFLAAPKENWFTCPTLFLSKLYSNTLLVSFNNRIFLRVGSGSQHSSGSTGHSGFRAPNPQSNSLSSDLTTVGGRSFDAVQIRTFKDTETGNDVLMDDIRKEESRAY